MKNVVIILMLLISTMVFSQEKPTKEMIKQYDQLVKQLNPIDSTLKSMYINEAKKDSFLYIIQNKLEQPYQYQVQKNGKMYPAIKEMYEEEQKWVVNPPSQEGFILWLKEQRNKK